MPFHVDSEVGVLRQVVVHRPGLELARLTPSNVDELLFDDVLWAQRAREEHDAFVAELRAHGAVVHYYADLLAQTLAIPDARDFVLGADRERAHRRRGAGPPAAARCSARSTRRRSRPSWSAAS